MKKLFKKILPIKENGFTVVEIILALVSMSIIMIFTVSALSPWVKSYTVMQERYKVFENARYGMSRMVKELQAVPSGSLGPSLTTDRIDYVDANGNPVWFELVGSQMHRGNDPFFDNVTSIQFIYYGSNVGPIPSPVSDPSFVRRIVIQMTVDPVGDTPPMQLQGSAFLRGYIYAGFTQ